jgi:AraC-like DNA-binding protein
MEQLDKLSTPERFILDFEVMGFQCIKVLGKYNYRNTKKSLETHKHDGMLEICFMEKGSQHYHVQGKDYLVKGGDILLTFPGEEHGTKGFPEEKGRLFWLIIALPKAKQKLMNLSVNETDELIQRLLQLKSNRKFKASNMLKHDLNKIFRIYKEKDSVLKRIQITNLLLGFILNVISFGEKLSEITISDDISRVCQFITENHHERISLESLADSINLSLSHFKFRFKKEIGIPPSDYILRQKIDKAKSILKTSTSIQDVAYDLAFDSSSYFATVFKRYTGQTPSQFMLTRSSAIEQSANT